QKRAAGRVTFVTGHWPGQAEVRKAAGEKFDVITSKNTLKNGYIHPAQQVDPRMLVHLEVSDDEFVKAVFKSLKPGGWFMIYNVCPAPSPPDKPYKPWSDGHCPFSREMLEKAGFQVVEFDRDDSPVIRELGRAFGWDKGESPMDLQN